MNAEQKGVVLFGLINRCIGSYRRDGLIFSFEQELKNLTNSWSFRSDKCDEYLTSPIGGGR